MWLPSWKTDDFFFLLRSGMHDESSENATIPRLQCLYSTKQTATQHSSVPVLWHAAATQERQGQSLAQAWRNTPRVKFQGSRTCSLSLPPWVASRPDIQQWMCEKCWHCDMEQQQRGPGQSASDEMLLGFIFSFPFFFFNAPLWKCSTPARVPFKTQILFGVCLFYPERYNKWIFYRDILFLCLLGKSKK